MLIFKRGRGRDGEVDGRSEVGPQLTAQSLMQGSNP